MNVQLKHWLILFILFGFVGGIAVLLNNNLVSVNIFQQTINSKEPSNPDSTRYTAHASSEIISKNISEIPVTHLPETDGIENISERERAIKMALLQINSRDVEARLHGIEALAELDPAGTVRILYDALARMPNEPNIEGMIILGALRLAHNEAIFTNDDVHYMYRAAGNDNIKGRLARIISYRGDDSVLTTYLAEIQPKLTQSNTEERRDMLYMLGSIESKLSLPYITPYLVDPDERVRVAALTALSLSANQSEIKIVEPMLLDVSSNVRHNAEIVLDYLLEKGNKIPLPDDIRQVREPNI